METARGAHVEPEIIIKREPENLLESGETRSTGRLANSEQPVGSEADIPVEVGS